MEPNVRASAEDGAAELVVVDERKGVCGTIGDAGAVNAPGKID